MNKLLYHLIQTGDVSHKILPQLTKAQEGIEVPSSEPEYKGVSIVDYLATKGYKGTKTFRKDLAQQYGIEDYNFSAEKNTELLNKLRENNQILKNITPTQKPISVEQIEKIAAEKDAARAAARALTRQNAGSDKVMSADELNRKLSLSLGYDISDPNAVQKRFKVNTPKFTLSSPQVEYDKFSLTPRLKNKGINLSLTSPAAPPQQAPVSNTVTKPAVKPTQAPVQISVTKPAVQASPQQMPFDFRNAIFFNPNWFLKPQSTLGPFYNPPQRSNPPQKSEVSQKVQEQEDKPWYEEAWDWVTSLDDKFENAVNTNPYFKDFTPTFGTSGFIGLEGNPFYEAGKDAGKATNEMINTASDYYEKAKNWYNRNYQQELKNERKSIGINPSQLKYDPVYVTGDTLKDDSRRYHIPELIDLDYVRFGTRNRGDFTELNTEGAPITTFEPFESSSKYFTKNDLKDSKKRDPQDATYIGIDRSGKLKVGGRDQFLDQEYQITRTYGNKVVDFLKNPDGSIARKTAPPKASRRGDVDVPKVQVLGNDGKIIEGSLNLLLPKKGKGEESFDRVTGGRYIFQTPDGKTKLVSGSLKMIADEFYRMKKNNPYVNVITLDNGSYSRGIRTYDKKITSKDLRAYDNQNTGGANFAYILPGEKITRYDSKFKDFEIEAKNQLQKKYPGKKVEIRFKNSGLYDERGSRSVYTQEGIQARGNSQTPVSMHNFDAARDYELYVDGKMIDPDKNKLFYQDILWKAADKTGLYHLLDVNKKGESWDPAHISLVREGQKTAFDELALKYPDIFQTPRFKETSAFLEKNKNNPKYKELYELLTNIKPFPASQSEPEIKQTGGQTTCGPNEVLVDGVCMSLTSKEYAKAYQKGIGRWQVFSDEKQKWIPSDASNPNAEFVSSPKTLDPVIVTSKIKPNSISDYSTQFYKSTPYQEFFNRRMAEEKEKFESAPNWAQHAVGSWNGNDKRIQNVTDQINQEYQNQFINYISDRLQKRSPQGSQGRDSWLSSKNFTNNELSFLTGSSNLPQPNLWAQTGQGLYNVLDFATAGALPEYAMPGIARTEVDKYNNPLLAASFLSVPAKAVQSIYKDNYSLSDALAGKQNNASIAEDIITDPLTWASFGAKGALTSGLNRLGKLPGPLTAAKRYIPGFGVRLNPLINSEADFLSRAAVADQTIQRQGESFVRRLLTPEGQARLRNQFKIADPNLTDEQLDWLVQTRINEVNNAAMYNKPKYFLENARFDNNVKITDYIPNNNAHFTPNTNLFNNATVKPTYAPKELFPRFSGNRLLSEGPPRFNLTKNNPFEDFTNPDFNPGSVTLGTGLETNSNVAAHELAHSVQGRGSMPVDADLLNMIKPKNFTDKLWRAGVRLDEQLGKDLKYFVTSGGRSVKSEPYAFLEELRNRLLNRGIINDEYQKITPWTLAKARLDALRQIGSNFEEGTRLLKFTPPWKYGQLSKIMNTAPAVVPVVGGAGILAGASGDNQKKKGGPIVSSYGQWAYPGKVTRIPASDITMQGVPYPVFAIPNKGKGGIMYPGENYVFPEADYVDEYPMMKSGGQHGGLDRWFAEKWVDVKTGKACGRQEGESRAYPACRPSRRVSSETPKTSSEMSPSEKAKFKRTKTSSERIPYNHKRK